MKLLHESISPTLEVLTENTSKGKVLYIEGPFLMSEAQNRNGRLYSKAVMEQAVDRYQREYVSERRAIGELNHPDYPFPDPKKAAIMVESLSWQGNNVIGKARVLNTPDGLIIKELLDANFKLGVSSRGLGEVKENRGLSEVTKFLLNAIDAVDLPSGQICYVNPVNESVNWVESNGVWIREQAIVQPQANPEQLLEALSELFKGMKSGVGLPK